MKKKWFNEVKILPRLLGIGITAVIFFAAGIFGFVVPQVSKALIKQKQQSIQHLVDSSYNLVQHYAARAGQGDISVEEAQKAAMQQIRQLRYENGNYIWINDLDNVMLMHPAKPDMEGKNFTASKDVNGAYLFKMFQSAVREKGSGFVEYAWPKPGADTSVNKISYVRKHAGWGWILGAGLYVEDVEKEVSAIRMKIIFIFLACGAATFIISTLLARSITRPLARGVAFAEKIAQGDLTQTLEIDQQNEIGTLAKALNNMVSNLNRMFKEVTNGVSTLEISSGELAQVSERMTLGAETASENAHAVAGASEEMSNNMNNVAAASEQAATNVDVVAAASEEMSSTVSEIARNSEHARSTSSEAVGQAERASTKIDKLGVAAREINKVTEVITEISEQTNLLALNATIEAARAGEAGKGFAVVANEIKELAKQTAQATGEIKQQITDIQNSTTDTISEISQITTAISEVNEIVSTIATSVEEQNAATREIAGNVTQASQGITEVNANVAQSSSAASEIAMQITGVNQAADEIANNSSQVNTNAHDLQTLSARLSKVVERFKTSEASFDIATVKVGHLKWRSRLEELFHGHGSLSASEVCSHHECDFGRWYSSPDGARLKEYASYATVGKHHKDVHTLAGEVATAMEKGNKSQAEKLMAQFEDSRIKLFDALDELYLC